MNLRQLKYAITVAKEGSFTKASNKLYISQPSLSQQIINLENELGIKLFNRQTGKIKLTYAGEHFVKHASKIVNEVYLLEKEMHDIAEMKKGRFVIGTLPNTVPYLLPKVLSKFKKLYPGIEIELVEEPREKLLKLTSNGQTDISIVSMPINDLTHLEIIPLLEEDIVAVLPSDHPLSHKQKINLAECANEPFILLTKEQGFRSLSEKMCMEAGFEPTVAFETKNIDTLQSLVSAGLGISLLPKMFTKLKGLFSNIIYLPISNASITRNIVICYRKERYLSKVATKFINIMQSQIQYIEVD